MYSPNVQMTHLATFGPVLCILLLQVVMRTVKWVWLAAVCGASSSMVVLIVVEVNSSKC